LEYIENSGSYAVDFGRFYVVDFSFCCVPFRKTFWKTK